MAAPSAVVPRTREDWAALGRLAAEKAIAARQWMRDHSEIPFALFIAATVSFTIAAFLRVTHTLDHHLFPADGSGWTRLLVPVLGALVSGLLVHHFFPDARGSGIPQTRAAFIAKGGEIPFRSAMGKFIACSISLGSGISLGREGPSVQIGAGMASSLAKFFGLPPERVKSLVPVGTASALATAFNTPIAAVLFTLEELIGDMHARVVGSVVLAAACGWMVSQTLIGDEVLFSVPHYQVRTAFELLIYVVLGVAGGVLSAYFVRWLLYLRKRFKMLPVSTRVYQPVMGGLTVGLMAVFFPGVLGVGYDSVNQALNGGLLWHSMLFLLILRLPSTLMSYASGNPGGVFGPSLYIGAMLGGTIGALANLAFPDQVGPVGAYALVGMGTTFAGIIRSPMTSVIMIFELTRDYSIIVPLMISNLISYYFSGRMQHMALYEALALQDGVHLPAPRDRRPEPELSVEDAMLPPPPLVAPSTAVSAIETPVGDGLLFIGAGTHLAGVVRTAKLPGEAPNRSIGFLLDYSLDLMQDPEGVERFPHVHPDEPLDFVLHRLAAFDVKVLPVIDRTDPTKLLGLVSMNSLMDAYRPKAREEPAAV